MERAVDKLPRCHRDYPFWLSQVCIYIYIFERCDKCNVGNDAGAMLLVFCVCAHALRKVYNATRSYVAKAHITFMHLGWLPERRPRGIRSRVHRAGAAESRARVRSHSPLYNRTRE